MKKTKFLALVLVVAIMLMGAGYAAWTDLLQVNSTVKTGYLDVDFTVVNSKTSSEWVKVTENYTRALDEDGEDYPQGSWDEVKLTIQDIYPGAWVEETVTFENRGTMPVKVSDVVITSASGNEATLDKMNVTLNDKEFNFANGEGRVDLQWLNGHNHFHWQKCTPKCPGYKPPVDPPVEPEDLILNPGESMSYTIKFELDESAENDITELKEVAYIISINFSQYNID